MKLVNQYIPREQKSKDRFTIIDVQASPPREIRFERSRAVSQDDCVFVQMAPQSYKYSAEYLQTYASEKYLKGEQEIFYARSISIDLHIALRTPAAVIHLAEIGYGNARFAAYVCERLRKKYPSTMIEYHGCDLSDIHGYKFHQELTKIKGVTSIHHKDLSFLSNHKFDWCFAFDVVEHTIDKDGECGGDGRLISSINANAFQITVPVLPCHLPEDKLGEFLVNWRHFKPDEHTMYFTTDGFNAWMAKMGWNVWQNSLEYATMSEISVRIPQSNILDLVSDAGGTPCDKCHHHIYSAVFLPIDK